MGAPTSVFPIFSEKYSRPFINAWPEKLYSWKVQKAISHFTCEHFEVIMLCPNFFNIHQSAKVYLEFFQRSTMQNNVTIIDGFQPFIIFTKRSIMDAWQGSKDAYGHINVLSETILGWLCSKATVKISEWGPFKF